ncbi:uncharacterized protein MELLADRAFT_108528 [Melampsora larici-populina 98AG31]|uniref:Uncharacterized protein n=1 Tax=Melampsora larici-populina (strain 98AG31 / pathotype 3-4-7) TaxID=747676 RepID=F4RTD7_MELLP|nr:uncharacterized protein MELLADRAFT_108528 [Melampsora larici-populina 98AG31]EGG04359.1 hypothetical protein MELLADRAFT_108528 [Melampsora larici-populina 98AG31]
MKFLPVPVQQSQWTMRRRPRNIVYQEKLTDTKIIYELAMCFINMSSLQISFDTAARTAMTATHLNYEMFYDDSEWQYGPISKYFQIPPNRCVLPERWVKNPRIKFGEQGWMNGSHLTNDRRDLQYVARLSRSILIEPVSDYPRLVRNLVKKESIDLIASWNFIKARDQQTSVPTEQVLHQSMKDVFERQSMELKKLWKPTESLLREVETMEASVEESIHQHLLEGPLSIWRRIGIQWGTKKIGLYYNTKSDTQTATNKTQRSDPEIESWYHYTTHQYYRVIKSIQEKLKFKPVIFLLSDNLESAFTSIATYMLQYPIEKQYNLIVAPDSHSVDPSSESHPEKKRKEDRIDDVADYVRDLTFAIEHLDVITCSLEQSETCNLIFLLGGSARAMDKDPTIRSIDERWYPTSSRASIDELALGLSNSHEKLVELARKLAKDSKNYQIKSCIMPSTKMTQDYPSKSRPRIQTRFHCGIKPHLLDPSRWIAPPRAGLRGYCVDRVGSIPGYDLSPRVQDLDGSPFSLRQWKPRAREGPQHPLRPLKSAKPMNESDVGETSLITWETISRPTLVIGKRSRGNEDDEEYCPHQIHYSFTVGPRPTTSRKKLRRTKSCSTGSLLSERDITDFSKHEVKPTSVQDQDNQISISQRSRSFEISLQNRKKFTKRPPDVCIQHPNTYHLD